MREAGKPLGEAGSRGWTARKKVAMGQAIREEAMERPVKDSKRERREKIKTQG